MASAKLIYDEYIVVANGLYEARITAYEVPNNVKFPDGIKLKCVLLDLQRNVPRLLLDNHEPFGYHMHTKLPHDKQYRIKIHARNYENAIEIFLKEVQRMVKNEI